MATIKHWQIGSETDRPIIRGSVRRLTEEEHQAEQRELERKAQWRRWRERYLNTKVIVASVWIVILVAGLVALVINQNP